MTKISVELKELFSFDSESDFYEHAEQRYSGCGVPWEYQLAVDSEGRICKIGADLKRSTREQTFPITVYDIRA